MPYLREMLCEYDPRWQEAMTRVREAKSLALMVMAVWVVVRLLAVRLLEEELALRAEAPARWPACEHCGRRRRSKGFRERRLGTLFGPIRWRRRVGRCPQGCVGSVVAPLDEALGLLPHQRTGAEVQWMGCLLAVFVPYETACRLLQHLTGVRLQAGTLWAWVQSVGQQVMAQVADELQELAAGTLPAAEPLAAEWAVRPLVMGADGVMAPFRPEPGTPKGKTRWREVKVAILARLGERLTRHGKRVTRLGQRRVVAVLGKFEDLRPRLWLEAVPANRYGHGRARGVALRWRAGFLDRIPALFPGARGHRDFRLLPCRAKPLQRRRRWISGRSADRPVVVYRAPASAAPRPGAAGVSGIGGPGRDPVAPRVRP